MMKNDVLIKQKLLGIGLSLGCYDSRIEKLSKEELVKITDKLEYGSTDVGVTLGGKEYIVEVFHVDNEVDLNIITANEYAKKYGRIFHNK
jgi:hypothetical protein